MTLRHLTQALLGVSCLSAVPACAGDETAPQEPDATEGPGVGIDPPRSVPLAEVTGARLFEDMNPSPNVLEVNLTAHYADLEVDAGVMTQMMAYNGGMPGPTLYARVGDTVIVHFENQMTEETTVHWHGLRISDEMDGNPRIQAPVQPGETFTYEFVLPEAGTYWYHPHSNTAEQIERGLYGAIVVAEEDAPVFTEERLLVLDDIRLDSDGQLSPFYSSGMDIMHGRSGNALVQNGLVAPITDTVPYAAIERWRIVNTATSRHMSLSIEGATWRIVGTDGGLLKEPYTTNRLEVTVGQRFEVEVRFDGEQGSTVSLLSHVLTLDENDNVVELPIPIAEYLIEGETVAEEPIYPAIEYPTLVEGAPVQDIVLSGYNDGGEIVFTINGKSGMEIPDLQFVQGEPRVLRVKNDIGPYHPFHLHGQFFQILERDGKPVFEPGLKDSVFIGGMEEVTIFTYFENPGAWMYHCHIPEHAENGMMGHMIVTPTE